MATPDTRRSGYAFKVYPDTTNMKAFRAYLSSLHIDAAISPLHDSDTYDESSVIKYEKHLKSGGTKGDSPYRSVPVVGDPVEPHFHVQVSFGKVKKSVAFMREIFEPFFGDRVNYMWFEPTITTAGYCRYLCHLTHECREQGKPVYNVNECQAFGDFDLSPLYDSTRADKEDAKRVVFGWITEFRIYNWPDLVDVAYLVGDSLTIEAVTTGNNAAMFQRYIEGNHQREKGLLPRSLKPETIAAAIKAGYKPVFGSKSEKVA